MIPTILGTVDSLEVLAYRSHSIRTLTRLLPTALALPVWGAAVAAVLWLVARGWASPAPLSVRFGVVILAAVLCNPHLIIYDAALLALPLWWFAQWFKGRAEAGSYWAALYVLFVAFAFPLAAVIHLQITVVVLVWMAWAVTRSTVGEAVNEAETVPHSAHAG